MYSSTISLYSFLGLFADAFIGRYRLIQFSLRVQWIVVLVSTFVTALQFEYKFPTWLRVLLFSIMNVIEMVGLSTFQVVSIVLIIKNFYNIIMLTWFSIGDRMPNDIQTEDPRSSFIMF